MELFLGRFLIVPHLSLTCPWANMNHLPLWVAG